jgi:hypothetical protein
VPHSTAGFPLFYPKTNGTLVALAAKPPVVEHGKSPHVTGYTMNASTTTTDHRLTPSLMKGKAGSDWQRKFYIYRLEYEKILLTLTTLPFILCPKASGLDPVCAGGQGGQVTVNQASSPLGVRMTLTSAYDLFAHYSHLRYR